MSLRMKGQHGTEGWLHSAFNLKVDCAGRRRYLGNDGVQCGGAPVLLGDEPVGPSPSSPRRRQVCWRVETRHKADLSCFGFLVIWPRLEAEVQSQPARPDPDRRDGDCPGLPASGAAPSLSEFRRASALGMDDV